MIKKQIGLIIILVASLLILFSSILIYDSMNPDSVTGDQSTMTSNSPSPSPSQTTQTTPPTNPSTSPSPPPSPSASPSQSPSPSPSQSPSITVIANSPSPSPSPNPSSSPQAPGNSQNPAPLATTPQIQTCNFVGTTKDHFASLETMYATGQGFDPSTTYPLYIVEHPLTGDSVTNGMAIPARVTDSNLTVATDSTGSFGPDCIWLHSQHGNYGQFSVIVDINTNGLYDQGIDVIYNNVQVGYTTTTQPEYFHVVPEVPLGTIAALSALFAAVLIVKRKSLHIPKL